MYDLKSTEAESIGKGYTFLRSLLQVTWVGSVVIGALVSTMWGMVVMGISGVGLSFLTGRVFVIQSLYRIKVIADHRQRLLDFMDNEFVLKAIKQDQIWRGEPVSPEIESRLAEFTELRTKLQDGLLKAVNDLFNDMKPTTEEKKEPN